MPGERLRGGRADVPDGERHQHPPQVAFLGLGEVVEQLGGVAAQAAVLVDEERRPAQLLGVELEQVALVGNDLGVQQRRRALLAEHLDVEHLAAGQVEDPLANLAGAGPPVGAADVDVALLGRRERCAAGRAGGRHDERAGVGRAQLDHRAEHLGDHVAGLAQHHRVADEHALALDLTGVVQGRQRDSGTGHPDRFEDGERGDPAGAPDVDVDVEQLGVDLLGRVFEGDRPAGRPAGRAETALDGDRVDLDHHAVDLVLDVVPVLAVVGDVFRHSGQVVHHLPPVTGGQSPRLERRVRLGLRGRAVAGAGADAVHHQAQRAGGGHPWVLLPQAAGGGVARVGERRLALLDQARVQVGERGHREVDLAAHLQELRHVGEAVGRGQPGRHALDAAHVGGDVLAGAAVAPGGGADQPALLVGQVDGEPVDLQLTQVGHRAARVALDPVGPGGQLLVGEGVVEREHPLGVRDRGEVGGEGAADPLGGRVGGAQRRVFGLQRLQLPQLLVELGVGDGRRVEDVVAVLVFGQLLAERGVPLPGRRGRLGTRRRVLGRVDRWGNRFFGHAAAFGHRCRPPVLVLPENRSGRL